MNEQSKNKHQTNSRINYLRMLEDLLMSFIYLLFRFLVNPSKDIEIRRWATEGLAYLTLDADIKEELVNDTPALKSLIEVTTVSFQ